MRIAEMKQILVDKFKAENCNFKKQDISIRRVNNDRYRIILKGYENIVFTMFDEVPDGIFDYAISIINNFDDDYIFVESKKGFDYESALIELGYHIATRF